MPSATMHNPSNARPPGVAAHLRVPVHAERPRKNLKKAETLIARSPAKHWTCAPSQAPEKSSPRNLKVPKPTVRSLISARSERVQAHANPNGIEQNRTGSNAKSHDLPTITGSPRQPVEKRPCPNGRRQPSGTSPARRSPDPARSHRRPPTLRSRTNSFPAALPGRSGCPLRSRVLPGRSGRP